MPSSKTPENAIYEAVSEGLRDTKVELLAPGLDGYEESIKRWSDAAEKRASAVIFPNDANDVSKIIQVLRETEIEFVVSGGRHSTGASSSIEDGVVIDLRKMNNVTVNEENKTLVVQGGCLWKDVDTTAAKYGLATPGGTVNHTGVGGLTLGGGIGYLSAKYGLVIDNLLSAELVLADGSIVRASEAENPDLFWAIRGAGASFAVCTEFVLQAHDQRNPVWAGILAFNPDKLEQIINFANKFHEGATANQTMFLALLHPPPHHKPTLGALVFHNGSEEEGKEFYGDLFKIGPIMDTTKSMPYEEVNELFGHAVDYGGRKTMSPSAIKYPFDLELIKEATGGLTEFIAENKGTEGSIFMILVSPYKKLLTVPLEAMAFANRGEYYHVETIMIWKAPELDQKCRSFARSMSSMIRERSGVTADRGCAAYANAVDHQVHAKKLFGVNTERLQELKKIYDPTNAFRRWHDLFHVER